ncbi:hypothetical protein V6N12_057873 [Hibiscus sabdariffa]|uniref:Uncharacterized protein n=1 Tax=Hibiscus sabdariffa TaxID=183260 RepID=A0ABR2B4D6_9ROSI
MDASIEDRYMPECRTNTPAVVKAQEQLRDSRDDKESPWIASVRSSHLYSRKVAIAYAQSGGRLGTGPEDGSLYDLFAREIMTPDQEGQVDIGSFAQYKRPLVDFNILSFYNSTVNTSTESGLNRTAQRSGLARLTSDQKVVGLTPTVVNSKILK